MRFWKSAALTALLTASAACFLMAFAMPGNAAERDLSQMEMARLFGGEEVYPDMCCEDDFMCFETTSTQFACAYRDFYNCDSWDYPNFYEEQMGDFGKYCTRPSTKGSGDCLTSDDTHVCLTRLYCYLDWSIFRCNDDLIMEFTTPNSCGDNETCIY